MANNFRLVARAGPILHVPDALFPFVLERRAQMKIVIHALGPNRPAHGTGFAQPR